MPVANVTEGKQQDNSNKIKREKQRVRTSSSISQALKEARQLNQDPNVLLVELEPLPAEFESEFAALLHNRPIVFIAVNTRSNVDTDTNTTLSVGDGSENGNFRVYGRTQQQRQPRRERWLPPTIAMRPC